MLLTATLELDNYAGSVVRNPYLSDRRRRMQDGHYGVLGMTSQLPGILREQRCFASVSSTPEADPFGAAEKERLHPVVDGLPFKEVSYDDKHHAQFFRLYLPDEGNRWLGHDPITGKSIGLPVFFLIHGGFWKSKWSCDNTQSLTLVPDFLKRGFAVVLVEYRRREMPGGKWPGPVEDVAKALQQLQVLSGTEPLDLTRIVVLGHSAGGQLALAACRKAASLKSAEAVKPCLCVSVASIPDMLPGFEARLSDEGDAIEQYMGFCPDSEPQRQSYLEASASSGLPLHCPTLLVTGSEDVDVPPRLLKDFYDKCVASPGGSAVEYLEIYGADHYNLITAGDKRWKEVARTMTRMLQDICKWKFPPYAEDYGVTEGRGFLQGEDPMVNSSIELPDASSPADADLFRSWESCVDTLPSHLNAGNVRQHIMSSLHAPSVGTEGELESWQQILLNDEARAERVFLLLSWIGHAWVWGEAEVAHELPSCVSIPWVEVARIVGRPPILTYYSFNACNWRRLDPKGPVTLGNICRLNNFLGGQDEEWFSMVHVAIEAAAGKALTAGVRAQQVVAAGNGAGDFQGKLISELTSVAVGIENMVSLLQRMKERCDPYIYYMRVRVFMKGWNSDETPDGMIYCGVPSEDQCGEQQWKVEKYFGETGAQSSVVPALDAALGLAMTEDALSPYLEAMRLYMPPKHAEFLLRVEKGPDVRAAVMNQVSNEAANGASADLAKAYNRCVQGLLKFRALHMELAFSFVRKWDNRKDEEIKGTGGTPFMPYLKKHRDSTKKLLIDVPA
eukprot:TRINITY_DN50379_c0_g1_i1.p1 TRINITY_DN50379_c0_g1~~TRINITY_DN50379_c0_g1_i1.p1  ORF type:complete len:918 (-),score=159.40 TRINITY_DN50379_c0_g1_i1:86-2449(-)